MRQKNPLTFLLSLLLLFVLDFLQRVYADDIAFIEPHMDGVYYAGSSMDIHYKVNFNGMAALGSAAVSLANSRTQLIVQVFPEATWLRDNNKRQVHYSWQIPRDIESGSYVLRVTGPASYPCSRHNNGRPPYDRCTTIIEASVSFDIRNP